MLDSHAASTLRSPGALREIQNAFDIRARHPLELELRLDRLNDAVGSRGGRVLAVSRGRSADGRCFAAVRYCLPLQQPTRHRGPLRTAVPELHTRMASF